MSKSFNFLSEPEHLIYFFCSLAFAYDHELGWDPTIQRVCIKGKTQYDITVRTDEGENLGVEPASSKSVSSLRMENRWMMPSLPC